MSKSSNTYGYISGGTNQVVKNSGIYTPQDIIDLKSDGNWGGSLEFIAEDTASSSTIEFVDKFSGYDVHKIELINCVPTAQTEFGIKFSNDSGSTYETTNYKFANQREGSASERRSTSQTSIRLGGDVTNGTDECFNGYFYIYNANNASLYTMITSHSTFIQSGSHLTEFGGGVYTAAETINGIKIGQGTTVTTFTSGTARLFGVKQI